MIINICCFIFVFSFLIIIFVLSYTAIKAHETESNYDLTPFEYQEKKEDRRCYLTDQIYEAAEKANLCLDCFLDEHACRNNYSNHYIKTREDSERYHRCRIKKFEEERKFEGRCFNDFDMYSENLNNFQTKIDRNGNYYRH